MCSTTAAEMTRFGSICIVFFATLGCGRVGLLEGGEGGSFAVACPPDAMECDAGCVDFATDEDHCGACDAPCNPWEACIDGLCQTACPPPQIACGELCVDPMSNAAHCGAGPDCDAEPGAVCSPETVCVEGSCVPECPGGQVPCDQNCIDPLTDEDHCGAGSDCDPPGSTCSSGELCVSGACEIGCPPGQVACQDQCIDPLTDEDHCGAGSDCNPPGSSCIPGELCVSGACALSCPAGQVACQGKCIDPLTDEDFCGASSNCAVSPGVACASGLTCLQGQCDLVCPANLTKCAGTCVDTLNDPANCGSCGEICDDAYNSVGICLSGQCTAVCAPGSIDCDGNPANGCYGTTTCPSFRYAFVTSQIYSGNMGGLAGADVICQTHADQANLGGIFKAWLSDSVQAPADRFTHPAEAYVRVDLVPIANGYADLVNPPHLNPINLTELGTTPPLAVSPTNQPCLDGTTRVWTGTSWNGLAVTYGAPPCGDWTSSTLSGSFLAGNWTAVASTWTHNCGQIPSPMFPPHCSSMAPLYCFQQ